MKLNLLKQRRYWECECCAHLMVTLPQDDARTQEYECPQCAKADCEHGGQYQEISVDEFADGAGFIVDATP